MLPLDLATPAQFAACLHQPFVLLAEGGSVSLLLSEVHAGAVSLEGRREPFNLTFQGAPELRLAQGIYRLEQATLGPMEIFLTQVAAIPQGSFFEAVFN